MSNCRLSASRFAATSAPHSRLVRTACGPALRVRQFFCPDCDRHLTERLAFAEPGKSHTHRQANGVARRWIFDCCAKQPFTEVGALLDVNAKTVERIYYRQVRARLDLPARYASVRRIGIDEIAHRKGKGSYCCVLVDLDRNIALDVLPSRTKKILTAHFERLGPEFCAQIESVSFDMWTTYSTISKHFFPQAIHVVDRFDVVKALNKVLDVFRRKLRREQPELEAFKSINRTADAVGPIQGSAHARPAGQATGGFRPQPPAGRAGKFAR